MLVFLSQRLFQVQDRIPNGHETAEDMDYAKKLADLQMKVRQLKEENSGMRRVKLNVSSSTPDLSNPDLYNQPNHRKVTSYVLTFSETSPGFYMPTVQVF